MSREAVLALLREHGQKPLSGQEMSRALGISRAAVWKAVEALRQEGYEISSAPNRGYTLVSGPDVLRPGELAPLLTGCTIGSSLLCLEEVDSTNTECKRRAMAGAPEGLAVLAQRQTGGRGRRGRTFLSPQGGLYLSVLLRPDLPPVQVTDMTAWVAVAVREGIEGACGLSPQIKWTNDIVVNGKKLGGILTEIALEGESHALDYLVVGIGINVGPQDFHPEVGAIATSLEEELGRPVDRRALAAHILRALDRMYGNFPHNKGEYLEKYRDNCLTVGKEVQVFTPALRKQARAVEVDEEFRLVVEYPDGSREALSAGEVSVRGMYGYV